MMMMMIMAMMMMRVVQGLGCKDEMFRNMDEA